LRFGAIALWIGAALFPLGDGGGGFDCLVSIRGEILCIVLHLKVESGFAKKVAQAVFHRHTRAEIGMKVK